MPSTDALGRFSPHALAALRIMTALLFIQHGTMKLFSFPGPMPMEIELFSLFGLAAVLELFGGILIVIGLFTRPVAFILSGFMAVAYFMAHATQGFYPALNQGELAVLYSFVFLYLFFAGPGAWSLDGLRGKTGAVSQPAARSV